MTDADEPRIDEELVRGLLVEQFPWWATASLTAIDPGSSSDHVLFRLGDDLLVRLPRRVSAAEQVEKEQRWLPVLGPHLPVRAPAVRGRGVAGHGYPWPWSVLQWLPGRVADVGATFSARVGEDLGGVVRALRRLDTSGGPPPGPHNGGRGAPLAERDAEVREALVELEGEPGLDLGRAREVWRDALDAPPHAGPPSWLHGDLLPGNLLVTGDGDLAGVIDFGCLGVGDPACDLMAAWTILPAPQRETFRTTVGADGATWARARGWALSFGLIALPYHRTRTPALADVAERTIRAAAAG